jgi:CO/xanthine dehydrogenase FAD-binding subunit
MEVVLRSFEYLKPTTLQEAVSLLETHGPKAKLIAGGTDVMVLWKKRVLSPEYLISLRNVPELAQLRFEEFLTIGAAVTHRTLELSPVIRGRFQALSDAVSNIGSVQVRNSATIGGNICNAAPSADTAPPLLVLEAEVHIASAKGSRSVALSEFFRGPSRTVLEPGEIVTHFAIPAPAPYSASAYWKQTRRKAMDLPILGVGCRIAFEEDLITCKSVRIALGVAAPTPMRAREAEGFLEGKSLEPDILRKAGEIAAGEASPRTTIRGSAWYRSEMIRVLVPRTAIRCGDRAKGGADA